MAGKRGTISGLPKSAGRRPGAAWIALAALVVLLGMGAGVKYFGAGGTAVDAARPETAGGRLVVMEFADFG